MKTTEELSELLKESLSIIAGDSAPEEIRDDMIVINEWGIDSEHGVELACDLSEVLGIEIPVKDNPLIQDDPKTGERRARTFGEVVIYLENLSPTQSDE